ncbi:MAG: hypothetical protein AAGU78_16335 [Chloroflexota bacterium]|jgi:hypothetical protein|nr:hypothetical protein [Anaerolineae bacterium]HMM29956.1 hypothetical protein [Aggregatilineaceae bacterium]
MDITRNWRLKTSRSQLLATRRPNGAIALPQHSSRPAQPVALYAFEAEALALPLGVDDEYARAAR